MINKDIMQEIVSEIMYSADEIKSKSDIDAQDYGKLLAFAEALSIIRDTCDVDELEDIGLNFDIDKKYL